MWNSITLTCTLATTSTLAITQLYGVRVLYNSTYKSPVLTYFILFDHPDAPRLLDAGCSTAVTAEPVSMLSCALGSRLWLTVGAVNGSLVLRASSLALVEVLDSYTAHLEGDRAPLVCQGLAVNGSRLTCSLPSLQALEPALPVAAVPAFRLQQVSRGVKMMSNAVYINLSPSSDVPFSSSTSGSSAPSFASASAPDSDERSSASSTGVLVSVLVVVLTVTSLIALAVIGWRRYHHGAYRLRVASAEDDGPHHQLVEAPQGGVELQDY